MLTFRLPLSSPAYHFLLDLGSIILIDLVLAGDNALVIAMAVRALPPRDRRRASLFGASLAVGLRILITIGAAFLIGIEFIKLVGGLFVVWIAVKVLVDAGAPALSAPAPKRLAQAIFSIVAADFTMSVDNILAIAGASKGNPLLIFLGLAISIPFLVLASNLLAVLMERFPLILYLGAAILGKVGGEMVLTDPFVERVLHPSQILLYSVEAGTAAAILIAGRMLSRRTEKEPGV